MSEWYYVKMEAARNAAEDAYFKARPKFDAEDHRVIFRAGFERAFRQLWRETTIDESEESEDAAPEFCEHDIPAGRFCSNCADEDVQSLMDRDRG